MILCMKMIILEGYELIMLIGVNKVNLICGCHQTCPGIVNKVSKVKYFNLYRLFGFYRVNRNWLEMSGGNILGGCG